jgi:DNA-directed RNA polymerase
MDLLQFCVKKEFILLYTNEKFLDKFHNLNIQNIVNNNYEIIKHNNIEYVLYFDGKEYLQLPIPKLPKLGNLDLQKIINSKYMIN